MTSINLYDQLIFEQSASSDIQLKVVMAGSRNSYSEPAEAIPANSDNLVLRAACLLREYAGVHHGAQITLIKRIPSAAGLGGGSSDAAATLAGLNRMWKLKRTRAELLELAARLGSDIGFFLGESGTAICRGRGELIEPLQLPSSFHFVVARPSTGLSTPLVFRHCHPNENQRSVDEFVQSMKSTGTARMVRLLLNDLQEPAESLNRDVEHLKKLFNSMPVLGHLMSGSGTSYFGICASSNHARTVAARLKAAGVPWVQVAQSRI
jgi:4-diphosphocytidyl-2-C-methyl-D-erythritol kinase